MKIKKVLGLMALVSLLAPARSVAQEISIDTLMGHIYELTSAKYEGRLSGSTAFLNAAEYVANTLQRYGVEPYRGEWAQYFETECNMIENCTFNSYVNDNDVKKVYVLGRDFCCAGMTGRGYADAPVVFCGYGIDNPAFDEYAHVDAKGKVVMVLSGTPNFLPSNITEQYTQLRDKARAALRHGACALVVINMSTTCAPYEVQGSVYNGELPHLATFPVIQPTQDCGSRLMQNETMELQQAVQAINDKQTPQSFHLRKKFIIDVNANYHPEALTANLIGVYPGVNKSMRDEYVVVGASLDHLGLQGTTCLFRGADNNASAVAALLETARQLQLSDDQPSRNVLFVLYSGSEQQFLGSRIFVSNFTPLKGIEAYVDVSSIGCGDSIMVMGNNHYPALWEVAHKVDTLYCDGLMNMGYKNNPKGNAAAFDKVGIPCINITSFNGKRHYNVPSDVSENIDRRYLTKATKLLFETVLDLSFGEYQGRSNASKRVRFDK